ncbi:hypothetical protein HELRODRAFT_175809 [Helobdella robusta]|uniref:Uncharacterized protein n=1 Tax=Helobdella robusta TaxID=6412 RepID=T1F9P5_HELRO|nr:hypothetical protein HELRODRAFT_175809 [Helobdella robusta]ESO00392.1 hypothetical protein HELRODRAFT_175809 [Helobdella robusta]
MCERAFEGQYGFYKSSDPSFIKYLLHQKNKFMRSGYILKAAAITKYINKLIINFNSKTFTNSKRGSKAMWEQVNNIRCSDKSFNMSTSQQVDANTLNTHFTSMSTDPSYKTPPTKATAINRRQHQQFTSYSVLLAHANEGRSHRKAKSASTNSFFDCKLSAKSISEEPLKNQLGSLRDIIESDSDD